MGLIRKFVEFFFEYWLVIYRCLEEFLGIYGGWIRGWYSWFCFVLSGVVVWFGWGFDGIGG